MDALMIFYAIGIIPFCVWLFLWNHDIDDRTTVWDCMMIPLLSFFWPVALMFLGLFRFIDWVTDKRVV